MLEKSSEKSSLTRKISIVKIVESAKLIYWQSELVYNVVAMLTRPMSRDQWGLSKLANA